MELSTASVNPQINFQHHFIEDSSCASFTNLYTNLIGKNSARLNWEVNQNAYLYRVRGKEVGTSEWINLTQNDGAVTHLNLTQLKTDTEYDWQVRAVCNASGTNSSVWSSLKRFRTSCEEPAFTTSSAIDSTTAKLSWQPVSGAHGYKITGANSIGQIVVINIPDGNASEYVLSNLEHNATYKWLIQTICDNSGIRFSPPTPSKKFNLSNSFKMGSAFHDESAPALYIYPNPSSGKFKVSHAQSCFQEVHEYEIFNLSGKSVFESKSIDCDQTLNLNLPRGTYLLRSIIGNIPYYQKLVISD